MKLEHGMCYSGLSARLFQTPGKLIRPTSHRKGEYVKLNLHCNVQLVSLI